MIFFLPLYLHVLLRINSYIKKKKEKKAGLFGYLEIDFLREELDAWCVPFNHWFTESHVGIRALSPDKGRMFFLFECYKLINVFFYILSIY